MDGDGLGEMLTRKVGPLPGWAWAAMAGVGVWYFFLRGKTSGSTAAASTLSSSPYGQTSAAGASNMVPTTSNSSGPGPTGPAQQAPGSTPPAFRLPNEPGWWNYSPDSTSPWGYTWHTVQYPFGQGNATPLPVGGAARKHASGSRSAHLMSASHPGLSRRVIYSHFVRSSGGAASHAAEIYRVAAASGVHPARLFALNPVYTGRIRIA